MADLQSQRQWLKSDFSQADFQSDQQKGVECPAPELGVAPDATTIDLPDVDSEILESNDLAAAIRSRRSRRKFSDQPIALAELGWLLWACQGVKRILGDGQVVFRTVPSAGARHPFETYVAALNVEDVAPGIWRYQGSEHRLVHVLDVDDLSARLVAAGLGQQFLADAGAVLVWSALPYRTEWRYHALSHKPILIDLGHAAQNLYLAVEAVGCGTCAIAAYDQLALDSLLGLDGEDEFAVYLAPVGKI
jgi:SagB-type dehydrogenase family enzyme